MKLRFYSVDDWMHNGLAISVFQYVNISIFGSHLIFVIQMYRIYTECLPMFMAKTCSIWIIL